MIKKVVSSGGLIPVQKPAVPGVVTAPSGRLEPWGQPFPVKDPLSDVIQAAGELATKEIRRPSA